MNTFPIIQTQRCILDCINSNDIPILQQIFNDSLTKQYLQELNDLVSSEAGIKQFLYSFSCYITRNDGILWGIYFDSKLVGFIAIMDIPDNPTLFYAMHPDYRSQGIMKECIVEVVNFISGNLRCDFIQSEVYKDNVVSIDLLQSVNFETVGSNENKIFLRKTMKYSQ